MSVRTLYILIGVLAIAVVVLGIGWYNEANKSASIDINVGNGGLSIKAD